MARAITLVDHTQRHAPPAGVLIAIAEALSVQIQRDFAPAWGVEDATVTVNGRGDKIHFFDNAHARDGYGYHEVDPQGQPYAHVAAEASLHAGNTWVSGTDAISASASHEVLEMLGDPWANEWCFDGNAKLWSREVCDPVQEDIYTIRVGQIEVTVSNFVLPAYFNPAADGPYDYLGVLTKPFTLAKGGYGVWDRATADHDAYGRHVVAHFDPDTPAWREKQKRTGYGRTWWRLTLGGSDPAVD
jgi:hypothetical protein